MTAQKIQKAFNSIFKDLGCKDTVEVSEVEGGLKFLIIGCLDPLYSADKILPYFLEGDIDGKDLPYREVARSDDEIREFVLSLPLKTQKIWERQGWKITQKHFRVNCFDVFEVGRAFSIKSIEAVLDRHAKDPAGVTRYLAAEEAELERKRLVSQAEDLVGEYNNLSEPCRALVREMIGVADQAVLLERIEQLEKASQGYQAREVGYLLLAQSLAGVNCDALRASARSKLEGEDPDLAKHWDF